MTERMAFSLISFIVVIVTFHSIVSSAQTSQPESRSFEADQGNHYESESLSGQCRGEWKSPHNCNTYNCDYKANWEYVDDTDEIVFTVSTKNRNKWTGIGFSENQAMPETDAVLGLVEESGRFFLMDSWLRAYEAPPLDPSQNLQNMSAWRENGITTLKFSRKRLTGDNRDFQFSDTNCPYLIFPVMGGVFNAVNKRIRKHEITPIISDRRVCIRSCKPSTTPSVPFSTGAKQDSDQTIKAFDDNDTKELPTASIPQTTQSPKNGEMEEISDNLYRIEMKFPGIWKQSLRHKNSKEYKSMINNIKEQMETELSKNYPGFSKISVNELTNVETDSNSLIANIDLAVKPMDDQTKEVEASLLSSTLNAMISDQLLGDLRVDPKYLVVARKQDESGNFSIEKESGVNFFNDDQTKWMIIFVGIAALIGLVLIQAFCMLWRDTRTKDIKQQNDKQSPNSQWKDYAAVNARGGGYSYDNYGASDETDQPIKTNGQSLGRGEKLNSSKHLYKNTAEKMPQKYISATLERQPSRSHRPDEFTSAYGTHARNAPYNRSSYAQPSYVPHLQPDFYFMPHQRRYSGEVVRVFVDYNNPQFKPQ